MRKIALVACVKDKLNTPSKAIELYNNGAFRSWIKDAQSKGVDQIYILSGKYGLLLPEEMIEPYDLNLNNQTEKYRIEWYRNVLNRLKQLEDPNSTHFILYTNKTYYKGFVLELKSFEIPYEID